MRRLLHRCLEKDAARRLHDVADARLELEEALAGGLAEPAAEASGAAPRPYLWMAVTALLAAATALLGVHAWRRAGLEAPVVRASIPAPPGNVFELGVTTPGAAAISADGRRLAFSARDESGTTLLWVRDLADLAARPLPSTEGAGYPFWSPDGRWIGFFAGNKLKKVDASGGPPLALCDSANGKGGTWSREGVIVFALTHSSPLHRVSAGGGESTPVTELDAERGEESHRHPRFLPDGRRFLYLARVASGPAAEKNRVLVASLDGDAPREIGRGFSNTEYASGHLLFVRENTLLAQPFDAGRGKITGDPFPVAEDVTLVAGASLGVFSASANGVLAYQSGAVQDEATLQWRSRAGEVLASLGESAGYREVRLSPDGKRAAVSIVDPETGNDDLWIWDVERQLKTRFTFTAADEGAIAWSPSGDRLAFASSPERRKDIYVKEVEGRSEETLLYRDELDKYPAAM